MGLRDAILSAVSSAITATGDIAESITYIATSKANYDVYTGKKEVIETQYPLNAIVTIVSDKVLKGSIASGNTGELSVLFAAKGLAFTPKTNDIVLRNSERYAISKIDTDPANASYTLLIRKLG